MSRQGKWQIVGGICVVVSRALHSTLPLGRSKGDMDRHPGGTLMEGCYDIFFPISLLYA
jgi:hypothetical protein